MCAMCSDYVVSCWTCVQTMRGGKGEMGKQFYLDSTFCEHFVERYHTDSPSMYSHVEREHYDGVTEKYELDCADECLINNWYNAAQLIAVVEAFNKWGEV